MLHFLLFLFLCNLIRTSCDVSVMDELQNVKEELKQLRVEMDRRIQEEVQVIKENYDSKIEDLQRQLDALKGKILH